MALQTQTIPVTVFQQNSTVLWCDETGEAAISDPGAEIDKLLAFVEANNLTLTKILLTHGHIDHVGHTNDLQTAANVPIIGPHEDDDFLLTSLNDFAARTGLTHSGTIKPDRWLTDGDEVSLGNEVFTVVTCPGHTPGHIVFYNEKNKLAVVGDVLFKQSIGRTDFPRGNHQDLLNSITQKLLPLGDDITFIPGHGPRSTFGFERLNNPFLV